MLGTMLVSLHVALPWARDGGLFDRANATEHEAAWCETFASKPREKSLSTAMRELLWVRRLARKIAEGFRVPYNGVTTIRSKVYEDNKGAIALATKPNRTS